MYLWLVPVGYTPDLRCVATRHHHGFAGLPFASGVSLKLVASQLESTVLSSFRLVCCHANTYMASHSTRVIGHLLTSDLPPMYMPVPFFSFVIFGISKARPLSSQA